MWICVAVLLQNKRPYKEERNPVEERWPICSGFLCATQVFRLGVMFCATQVLWLGVMKGGLGCLQCCDDFGLANQPCNALSGISTVAEWCMLC